MLSWERQPRAQVSQFHDIPDGRKPEHPQLMSVKARQLSKVIPS